jgi:hypothetical protein
VENELEKLPVENIRKKLRKVNLRNSSFLGPKCILLIIVKVNINTGHQGFAFITLIDPPVYLD